MIKDQLNTLIAEAMKSKDKVQTETYRAIKTAIMNWETAKENVGKTFGEIEEINVLKKLATQYEETAEVCNDGKHDNLVNEAITSAKIIRDFLPAPVSEEDIKNAIEEVCKENNYELIKKNMGNIIKGVKAKLPAAEGKTVSQIVSSSLI